MAKKLARSKGTRSDSKKRSESVSQSPKKKAKVSEVGYLLGLGTPQVLDARVNREEIRLFVNGPGMHYGKAKILTSLDVMDGATHAAWTKLSKLLTCASYCGENGTTPLPITVEVSSVGCCLSFSTGPMTHYQSMVVLRPKKKDMTMRQVIDDAFVPKKKNFMVLIVPEPLSGEHGHNGGSHGNHSQQ